MAKVDQNDCWEAMVNGATGDEELDTILSILDFPMESLEGNGLIGDWDSTKSSNYLVPDVLMGVGSPVLPPQVNATSEIKEPISYLPKDSLTFVLRNKSTEAHESKVLFQKQSPVSVLESWKTPLVKSCKQARSKRARPSGSSTWLSTVLPSRSSRKNRESRRKLSQHSMNNPLQAIAKRCAHCQVTKTPQWREGPMGPKTLCNACGVRFRSGRLFPEYRPAASPTFVASVHSNSHRKVVEMRTKGVKQQVGNVERPPVSMGMEFVPASGYLFDDAI